MFIKRISNDFLGFLLHTNMKAIVFRTDVSAAKLMLIFLNKSMITHPKNRNKKYHYLRRIVRKYPRIIKVHIEILFKEIGSDLKNLHRDYTRENL